MAFHDLESDIKINQVKTSIGDVQGTDKGLYYGAGIRISLHSDFDLFADYTLYKFDKRDIDYYEILIGMRYHFHGK